MRAGEAPKGGKPIVLVVGGQEYRSEESMPAVGSSTLGIRGGYIMPGLLMGSLQIGWFAVATALSTTFILTGLLHFAEQSVCNLLIPHKATSSNAKS
jgi:hypothetical protein